MEQPGISRIPGSYQTYEEAVWTRRGTWGSIVFGALVGLAITLVMAVVAAAAGVTGGAAAAKDDPEVSRRSDRSQPQNAAAMNARQDQVDGAKQDTKGETAKKAGLGAGLFLLVTALLSGFFGGWIAGRVAQVYPHDVNLVAIMTWAVGIVLLFLLGSIGSSGLLAGLGGAAGRAPNPGEADPETVRQAAAATAMALWGFVIAQAAGLAMTFAGARAGMKRRIKLYPTGIVRDRQEGREYTGPHGAEPQPLV